MPLYSKRYLEKENKKDGYLYLDIIRRVEGWISISGYYEWGFRNGYLYPDIIRRVEKWISIP